MAQTPSKGEMEGARRWVVVRASEAEPGGGKAVVKEEVLVFLRKKLAKLGGGKEDAKEAVLEFLTSELAGGKEGLLKESDLELLREKLAELLRRLRAADEWAGGKVDEVFPPGTRANTLLRRGSVALPVVVAVLAAVLVAVLLFCWWHYGGRRAWRMMRAPGRGGALMRRAVFEANPRAYFRGLRAGVPLVP